MKKLNFKSTCIGFIVGISLSISSIALAAPQQIEVLYNNIKVLVNGKELVMDEQAFMKNGRTFVPARFIAEAFGAQVTWNETTSTVNIDSTNTVTPSPTVTPTPTPSATPTPTVKEVSGMNKIIPTIQKDGFTIYIINNIEYMQFSDVPDQYKFKNVKYINGIVCGINKTDETIDIKSINIDDRLYVPYDYFKNTLIPFITK